jgi:hypothetical protein
MTQIIAILLVLGQFEVAVETSTGWFTATYPDTETGVRQFLRAIQTTLESESRRFYPCIVHDESIRDVGQSPIALRIGPGTGHGTSLVGGDRVKAYFAARGRENLDARVAEKICLSLFPRNYQIQFPLNAGVREFYRRPPAPTEQQIAQAGACEAVLEESVRLDTLKPPPARMRYGLALGRLRLWAADHLEPPALRHPLYAKSFHDAVATLDAANPQRGAYLTAQQQRCLGLGLRLD